MNKKLITHPQTDFQLNHFREYPSHAVVIVGKDGSGKGYLARNLAAALLEIELDSLVKYPYFTELLQIKNSLTIDQIRELQKFVQLKTTGTKDIRRIAIIEHADSLSLEAQNAFLKLLEEPPDDTVLLLTASSTKSLLPTIISRLQIIDVNIPEYTLLNNYFNDKGYSQAEIDKIYHLSGGLPGLMHSLLNDEQNHPLVNGVNDAKKFLSEDKFNRLVMADYLSKQKDKDQTIYMIEALQRIAQTGLLQASSKQNISGVLNWYKILYQSYSAKNAMSVNTNLKLVLTNLAINI